MKIGNILTTVGTTLLKNIVPGAGIILDTVNAFLPEEKKLDIGTATGQDVTNAINSLPADQQAQILSKELDVEIAEITGFTERFNKMAEADKVGNTNRPEVIMMMAKTTCFIIIAWGSALTYAVFTGNTIMIDRINTIWPLALTMLGVPTALLRSYFALRSSEKKARYQMAAEKDVAPNLFNGIMKLFKK